MNRWKASMPQLFENKDYRMTWVQYWKAEELQQKDKGLQGNELQIIKDQQRDKFRKIAKTNGWYFTVDNLREYITK